MIGRMRVPSRGWGILVLSGGLLALTAVSAVWQVSTATTRQRQRAHERLQAAVSAQARSVERRLADIRTELAFLAHSSALEAVVPGLHVEPGEERWRRVAAEGALLLFLRAHPEVRELQMESHEPIVRATRRGGVPVVWMAEVWKERPAPASRAPGPWTTIEAGERRLHAELEPAALALSPPTLSDCTCRLGTALQPGPSQLTGRADLLAGGWEGSWELSCRQELSAALSAVPRFGSADLAGLLIGGAVLAIALAMAAFGAQEVRRSHAVEARTREQERRRALEGQLLHSERLATMGRLAAGIAHELNNPLEGMTNYLALARGDVDRRDWDKLEKHLNGIGEGIDLAGSVVGQVLAGSDAGTEPTQEVELAELVEAAVAFLGSRRDLAAIDWVVDLPRPLRLHSHPTLLRQVFLNLLLNACEAQPDGGEVSVAGVVAGEEVRIDVSDRGPGVAPEDVDRIFEPFFSTRSSSGLGLYVSRSIVLQLGGSLSYRARAGGGASFTVRLPRLGYPDLP